jgi:2-polyprenyl-3-methyl-5-hydroxy-6-metoxy-1,4-benzoquinol methylase
LALDTQSYVGGEAEIKYQFLMIKNRNIQDVEKEIAFFNAIANTENEYDSLPKSCIDYVFTKIGKFNFQGPILDGGCGNAAFGKKLIEQNPDISVIGVDLVQKYIDYIDKLKIPGYQAICGNLENINLFKANTFDCLIYPCVLHHFPNIKTVVNNSFQWLNKNGVIIIIDPNGSNLILRFSYWLRIILYRCFPKQIAKYASANEKHISIKVFKINLEKYFEIKEIKTFPPDKNLKVNELFSLMGLFSSIRFLLYKAYSYLPFIKYSGSALVIIGIKKENMLII